jgi:hypothetical protein
MPPAKRSAAKKRPAARRAAPKRKAPRGRAAPTSTRKPAWLEADEREARRENRSRKRRPRRHRRLAVVYDIEGPRVRLGIAWFFLEMVALVFGVYALALLFAVTAGLAALQTARTFRLVGGRPHRELAGAGAAALVIAAAIDTGVLGVALIGLGVGAVLVARGMAATDRRIVPLAAAGLTVRASLFVGLAAASVVETARFSIGGVAALLLIVAAYEVGDYIVGSGANNAFEGPVAGAAAIVVVTFAVTALGVDPFTFPNSFALAALAAVLCPVGQLMASLILPSVRAPASALRRLDSLLLLAPIWAIVIGRLVAP